MSYIAFTTKTGEARLRGPERAHFNIMQAEYLIGQVGDLGAAARGWMAPFLPSYMSTVSPAGVSRVAETALRVGYEPFRVPGYHNTTDWTMVAAQTVQESGDDVLRLASRLHMQCELHAWIDGSDRAWVADIIDKGLASGVFRPGMNWEVVTTLLRESADGPVVTYASQAESFPNYPLANVRYETFEKWTAEKRWDACVAKLRKDWGGCKITPDWWDEFYWQDAVSLKTLKEAVGA